MKIYSFSKLLERNKSNNIFNLLFVLIENEILNEAGAGDRNIHSEEYRFVVLIEAGGEQAGRREVLDTGTPVS